MAATEPISELSRPFAIAELGGETGGGAENFSFQASVEECAGLALRFELLALESFMINGAMRLDHLGNLVLEGRIEGRLVQSCVTSLEPVPGTIEEKFALIFSKDGHEAAQDEPNMDLPEPWPGEVLDLGEIAAQQLGLALDPYPKAVGVEADRAVENGPEGSEGTHKPFLGLAGLRDRLAGKS